MKYLNTMEIGYDPDTLGFPSVETCQAIVYVTDFGLFGYHDALGNPGDFGKRCTAVNQFVQNLSIDHKNHAQALIGVIVRYSRFGKNQQTEWAAQVGEVATALNFDGPVYGARLESHIGKGGSAYVRFDRLTAGEPPVRVSYKRWSKMDFDRTAELEKTEGQFGSVMPKALTNDVVKGMNMKQLEEANKNRPYGIRMPPLPSYAVVRRGKPNEGNLNVVKSFVRFS